MGQTSHSRPGPLAPILHRSVIVATVLLLTYTAGCFRRLLVWGGATATSLGLLGFAANSASMAVLS